MRNVLQARIDQHQLLIDVRVKLLRLHKLLLEIECAQYEQIRGRVSKGRLLQLVIHDAQFAWLHRLSEMIVHIDGLLQADEPLTSEIVASLAADIRFLLTPDELGDDFARKYDAAFQRHPDVILAHADIVGLLPADA